MPIPLFKLATLGVKVLTQPLLTQTKRFFLRSEIGESNKLILYIGNKVHYYETKINRKFLEEDNPETPIGPITDEIALEKAFTFLLEVVVLYGILGYIAYTELVKTGVSKEKLKEKIEGLEANQLSLQSELSASRAEISKLTKEIEEFKYKLDPLQERISSKEIFTDSLRTELKEIRELLQKMQGKQTE